MTNKLTKFERNNTATFHENEVPHKIEENSVDGFP